MGNIGREDAHGILERVVPEEAEVREGERVPAFTVVPGEILVDGEPTGVIPVAVQAGAVLDEQPA